MHTSMKETLLEAGSGEKGTFPILQQAGGYEFFHCVSNTKQLEILSTKVAQSPKYLWITAEFIFIPSSKTSSSLSPKQVQDTCLST